jgi:hypothetical protein
MSNHNLTVRDDDSVPQTAVTITELGGDGEQADAIAELIREHFETEELNE